LGAGLGSRNVVVHYYAKGGGFRLGGLVTRVKTDIWSRLSLFRPPRARPAGHKRSL
jgi:hypothetical protein